jgi:hypothetical protein
LHPSEEPRRAEASVLVFHLADVETCDASWANWSVYIFALLTSSLLVPHIFLLNCSKSTRWSIHPTRGFLRQLTSLFHQNRGVGLFVTHVRPKVRETFVKAGILELLGHDAFHESVTDAIAVIEGRRLDEQSFAAWVRKTLFSYLLDSVYA